MASSTIFVTDHQNGLSWTLQVLPSPAQSPSPQDHMKCPICLQGEAGKHIYYGGRGCLSCRGFFRRAVQSEHYKHFGCKADGNCSIDSKSRKACQWCRFQKCLQSGMNIKFVMDLEQRKTRMMKRSQGIVKSPQSNIAMSTDELAKLCTMARSGMEGIFSAYNNTYNNTGKDYLNFLDMVQHPRALTYEEVKAFEAADKHLLPNFFWNYEDVQTLSENDRKIIIVESFPAIFVMFWSITAVIDQNIANTGAMDELYWRKWQERTKKLFGDNIEQFPQVLELTENLKKGKYPTVSYEMVYSSPWASSSDEEDRHRFLSLKIDAWLMGQDGKQDLVTCWLIVLIMIFCPDYAGLSKRDHIGNIQTKYLCLLQKYLKLKYGKMANKKLHEGLMIKSYAEDAYKIHENMLRI